MWLFYELPNLNSAIFHASFYPCTVGGACHGPEPRGVSWIMFIYWQFNGSRDEYLDLRRSQYHEFFVLMDAR